MQALHTILLIISLITGGSTVVEHMISPHDGSLIIPDSSFHEITLDHASKVDNGVQAALLGQEPAANVFQVIGIEY